MNNLKNNTLLLFLFVFFPIHAQENSIESLHPSSQEKVENVNSETKNNKNIVLELSPRVSDNEIGDNLHKPTSTLSLDGINSMWAKKDVIIYGTLTPIEDYEESLPPRKRAVQVSPTNQVDQREIEIKGTYVPLE